MSIEICLTINDDGSMTVGTGPADQSQDQGGNDTPVNLSAIKHLATQAMATAGQQQAPPDQSAAPDQTAGPSDDDQQNTAMMGAYNGPGGR